MSERMRRSGGTNFQEETWNGPTGQAWAAAQEMVDGLYRPVTEVLVAELRRAAPRRVLDVGCGAGAVSLAAARELGAEGEVLGVDISEPMLAVARARAEREGVAARFLRADAGTHPFEADSFDLLLSRFGVMFFADPAAAFANLRAATRPGGELRFVVWRGPEENSFMTTPDRAAAGLLPDVGPRRADEPGPFGLADRERAAALLAAGGWDSIAIEPLDLVCSMPRTELPRYVTSLGPVARALAEADEATRERALAAIIPAFDEFVDGDQVRQPCAFWLVAARA